jgi:hypothetical protein
MQDRQHMLREFGFIELLTDVIYIIDKISIISKGSTRYNSLVWITHTTLRLGIKEYRPNELYSSQWLELILDKTVKDLGGENNHAT